MIRQMSWPLGWGVEIPPFYGPFTLISCWSHARITAPPAVNARLNRPGPPYRPFAVAGGWRARARPLPFEPSTVTDGDLYSELT
jgi:hypothetical protein